MYTEPLPNNEKEYKHAETGGSTVLAFSNEFGSPSVGNTSTRKRRQQDDLLSSFHFLQN
jgi:hypothetical protein